MAFVMELIGSLVYILLLLYTIVGSGTYPSNGLFIVSSSAFWLPLVYAAGVISAILLFLLSFTNLMPSRSPMGHKYPTMMAFVAGFSWVALSAGNQAMVSLAIVGFIVSMIGSVLGWMRSESEMQ